MAVSYKKLWKLLIDRDMKKKAFIRLNLDGKKSEFEKEVIYKDNTITYFDNDIKMIINLNKGEIVRENNDYHSLIKVSDNKVVITLKSHNIMFDKEIRILDKKIVNNYFYLKYLLVDENIINEYEIKL